MQKYMSDFNKAGRALEQKLFENQLLGVGQLPSPRKKIKGKLLILVSYNYVFIILWCITYWKI